MYMIAKTTVFFVWQDFKEPFYCGYLVEIVRRQGNDELGFAEISAISAMPRESQTCTHPAALVPAPASRLGRVTGVSAAALQ